MEISVGGDRFERYKTHAYWANVNLDTRFTPQDAEDFTEHVKDCIDNPTRGLLARKHVQRNGINYPLYYYRNLQIMLKDKECKQMCDTFDKKFAKLYPKTGNSRKFLIDKGYVVLNYVKEHEWTVRKQLFKLFGR